MWRWKVPLWDFSPINRRKGLSLTSVIERSGRWVSRFSYIGPSPPWLREALRTSPCTALSASNPSVPAKAAEVSAALSP